MNDASTPTFVDLFCGCGGLSLGFLDAGFRCLVALDSDPKAIDVYNRNLNHSHGATAQLCDLSTIRTRQDARSVLRKLEPSGVQCDILVGGPPCQSFSVVGQNKIKQLMESDDSFKVYWQKKNKTRTSLFEAFALFLEVLGPRWFLFENVPTITNHESFPKIVHRLQSARCGKSSKLGYKVYFGKYLASEYGVPQDRRRFFMVGQRDDLSHYGWLPPENSAKVSVLEALDDLPRIFHGSKEREVRFHCAPGNQYQNRMRPNGNSEDNSAAYDHVCRWHNADDVELFSRMDPGAKFVDPKVQTAIRIINPKHKLIKYATDKFRDKLHKLDPSRPAWTVTAHLQKDCYKFIHYRDPRTISVREAARLQSFPDWFRFDSVSMVNAFGQIGNAVPPLLAEAFAKSIIEVDDIFKSSMGTDNVT